MSEKWINCKIKKLFDELFPRTIVASYGIGPSSEGFSLEKGNSYNAVGVTKEGCRWMYIVKQGNKEVTWGAEHFE